MSGSVNVAVLIPWVFRQKQGQVKLLRSCQSEGICAYSLENLKIDSLYKEGVLKKYSNILNTQHL